jgi:acetyl/propionyl-CoA carboxylase alpha subunit
MKLQVRVRDRVHTLEVSREGNRFEVAIDGILRLVDLVFSDASHDVLLIGNACYDVVSVPRDEGLHVNVFNRFFDIELLDPRRALGGEAGPRRSASGILRASMPGRVVKLLVENGSVVDKGQGLLVLEAMKMQNELRAPRAGTVREIAVKAGDTVEAGRVLLTVAE